MIKRIINTWICTFCIILVGCSSDDTILPTLTIIKSDVNVKAIGGDAVIQLQSTSQVQATSDVDWCKVVEANSERVNLTVEPNTGYSGRSAQIIITDGSNTQQVTLLQDGAILIYNKAEQIQYTGNKAANLPIEISSSFPIQVTIPEKDKEWLSFEVSEDGKSGIFHVQANETGAIRGCETVVSSGNRQLIYQVLQYDIENLLGNDWQGIFQSGEQNFHLRSITITNSTTEEGVYIISGIFPIGSYDYKLKATYQGNGFSLSAGQYLGDYLVQNIIPADAYFCIIDQNSLPNWTDDYSIGVTPLLLQDGTLVLAFLDNGGVPGGTATGFTITAFRGAPSYVSFVTHIQTYYNCFFYK